MEVDFCCCPLSTKQYAQRPNILKNIFFAYKQFEQTPEANDKEDSSSNEEEKEQQQQQDTKVCRIAPPTTHRQYATRRNLRLRLFVEEAIAYYNYRATISQITSYICNHTNWNKKTQYTVTSLAQRLGGVFTRSKVFKREVDEWTGTIYWTLKTKNESLD